MENQDLKKPAKIAVGHVTISKYDRYRTLRGYMSKSLRDILKSSRVVFNPKKLRIRLPDIDTKKSCSIKGGYFSFVGTEDTQDFFVGKYNVFQKDEDTYVLKKIKVRA